MTKPQSWNSTALAKWGAQGWTSPESWPRVMYAAAAGSAPSPGQAGRTRRPQAPPRVLTLLLVCLDPTQLRSPCSFHTGDAKATGRPTSVTSCLVSAPRGLPAPAPVVGHRGGRHGGHVPAQRSRSGEGAVATAPALALCDDLLDTWATFLFSYGFKLTFAARMSLGSVVTHGSSGQTVEQCS